MVFISVSLTRNMWDSQLGRLEKAGMSPFKGAASGSWSSLLQLQLVTSHRKKESAQGRMLGGPMREKRRDLGKGRALGSYKMPRPPGHLVLGICHFTLSVRWSLQFLELPIPRTLQIIIPHPIAMEAQLGFKYYHPYTRICRPAQG